MDNNVPTQTLSSNFLTETGYCCENDRIHETYDVIYQAQAVVNLYYSENRGPIYIQMQQRQPCNHEAEARMTPEGNILQVNRICLRPKYKSSLSGALHIYSVFESFKDNAAQE